MDQLAQRNYRQRVDLFILNGQLPLLLSMPLQGGKGKKAAGDAIGGSGSSSASLRIVGCKRGKLRLDLNLRGTQLYGAWGPGEPLNEVPVSLFFHPVTCESACRVSNGEPYPIVPTRIATISSHLTPPTPTISSAPTGVARP